MRIGEWPAVAGMASTYRQARSLGLESNLAELEAFGFTIVEPAQLAGAGDIVDRLRSATLCVAERGANDAVELNRHANRPAVGRQLFHLLAKDAVYRDAMLHPVVQTFARYLLGDSVRLLSMVAFLKEGAARPTLVHTDSVGVPSPLPPYGSVCNISWLLTDYHRASGTLCFYPGSHRLCRQPGEGDFPRFMGGPVADEMYVPLEAPAGSLVCFHGNLWHGTYPKTTAELRAHVVVGFCRGYYQAAESYADLDETVVAAGGKEFARQIGREAWQGYGSSGPDLAKLVAAYPATRTPYG